LKRFGLLRFSKFQIMPDDERGRAGQVDFNQALI